MNVSPPYFHGCGSFVRAEARTQDGEPQLRLVFKDVIEEPVTFFGFPNAHVVADAINAALADWRPNTGRNAA